MTISTRILEMYNSRPYQALAAFYNKQTVFNILKIERNENRHSAFLRWLFDPSENHNLGDVALKKFLGLYASCASACPLTSAFITGNYQLDVLECTTEKMTDAGKTGKRMDIWMELKVTYDSNEYIVPVVIENKIYSNQSENQTENYHDFVEAFIGKTGEKYVPVEVFLAPENKKCTCPFFTHITYQQLLIWVLEPVFLLDEDSESGKLLDAFIRNLSKPATDTSDSDTKQSIKNEADTILAVSKREADYLQDLYKEYKDVLDHAIVAVVGDKAKSIFPATFDTLRSDIEAEGTMETLLNLWDANSDIFRSVLYVCRDKICPGQPDKVLECFKSSKRDNSKYVVERRNEEGNWESAAWNFAKPMPKGRAACLFFTVWGRAHSESLTVDDIKSAFPLSLNAYYGHRKDGKFDSIVYTSPDDEIAVSTTPESSFQIPLKVATWEFYTDGYLGRVGLDNGDIVYLVKMWRKDDFDRLLKHIEDKAAIFDGFRIRMVQ